MLMNIGAEPAMSRHQLLTTVGWRLPDKTEFALEGSVFIGGRWCNGCAMGWGW